MAGFPLRALSVVPPSFPAWASSGAVGGVDGRRDWAFSAPFLTSGDGAAAPGALAQTRAAWLNRPLLLQDQR